MDAWLAMRRHYALESKGSAPTDRAEAENDKARDFFAALKAKAESRRDG